MNEQELAEEAVRKVLAAVPGGNMVPAALVTEMGGKLVALVTAASRSAKEHAAAAGQAGADSIKTDADATKELAK